MISNTALREVESNSASSKEFSIKNSSKMFNMIISGLYSDKPQSITREIWSNAFDAHCMVGKGDVPFVVSMPNSLMPTFVCRDFGPGIHHDDMEGFYTVLGHSTKEDTNAAVGKWGVGRMSPMSYTDSFSVTSYHKGRVAHYSVQLGADGAPALHTLAEPTPTTEPDGLEVSFPVQRKDLQLFSQAAQRVSLGFDVKPEVRGSTTTILPKLKCTVSGDGWKALDLSGVCFLDRGIYAKMGCVIYPIDTSAISGWSEKVKLQTRYSQSYLLEFDIGELEVTASREGLQYGRHDPTSESIIKRANVVAEQLVEKYVESIQNAPTYGDALIARANSHGLSYQQNTEVNGTKWRGQELNHSHVLDTIKTPHTFTSMSAYEADRARVSFSKSKDIYTIRPHNIYISVGMGKDRDLRANERVTAHNKGLGHNPLTWFKVYTKPEAEALLKELKARMGTSNTYTMVSDMPDPGPRVTNRVATTIKSCPIGRYHWDDYEMQSEEFDKGGIYLPISNNQSLDGQSSWNVVAKYLHKAGVIKSTNMIVVPKTHWKKFEDAANWKPLWDAGNEFILKDRDKKVAFVTQRFAHSVSLFNELVKIKLQSNNQVLLELRSHAVDLTQELWGLTREEMYKIMNAMGTEPKNENPVVEALVREVLQYYPLLKNYSVLNESRDASNYVAGMDLLREQREQLDLAA
jgi:hypothetical protein